jgi:hypothetical protein
MKMKHVLSAGLGILALGLVATTAQAAPLAGPGSVGDAQGGQASLVEKTHWWGDRYYYGHRRHYYGYRYYKPYYYGYYKPYYGYYYPRHFHYRHHYRHHHRYGY